MMFRNSRRAYTTWKVDGATPMYYIIGLSWPLTKPPFGSCAIYFHHGARDMLIFQHWGCHPSCYLKLYHWTVTETRCEGSQVRNQWGSLLKASCGILDLIKGHQAELPGGHCFGVFSKQSFFKTIIPLLQPVLYDLSGSHPCGWKQAVT